MEEILKEIAIGVALTVEAVAVFVTSRSTRLIIPALRHTTD
jgi:hypothetical protein